MKGKLLIDDNDKKVTVRIWYPKYFGENKSPGHVSLETFCGDNLDTKTKGELGIYASFYPTGGQDLLRDTDNGKTPADVEVNLYSLNVDKINEEYKKFVESDYNWSLFGSTFFKYEKTQNCSGLVAFLLKEGDINKLFSSSDHIKNGMMLGAIVGAAAGGFAGTFFSRITVEEPIFEKRMIITTVGVSVVSGVVFLSGIAIGMVGGTVGGIVLGGLIGSAIGTAASCSGIPDDLVVTPSDIAKLVKYAAEKEKKVIESNRINSPSPF